MMAIKIFCFIALFGLLSSVHAQTSAPDSSMLMKHVRYLSSEELNGRLPGTEGYEKALEYSMNYLSSLGVIPISSEYWPQRFTIDNNVITDAYVSIDDTELKAGTEFSVRGYSGAGKVQAEVIFCGYGFDNGEYNDYAGLDLTGKIAMVFKGNPSFIEGGPRLSIREKADIAYSKGAKAIIFVSEPNSGRPQYQPIGSVMHGDGPVHIDMPQIQVSIEIGDIMVKSSGLTLSELQSKIDSLHKPVSFNTKVMTFVTVETEYNTEGNTANIVGVLPGQDPKLKNEYLIVSAHIDHVGSIGDKVFYPGANDNASGSAAVLELARVFSANSSSLKRSVIFVLFGSEEKGLVGSEYLAEYLPVEKEQIVAMFNMDCIGHGDSIQVGNGKSCPGLWEMATELDSVNIHRMVHKTWGGGGADLTPFHNIGIPGLYFVTTNSYTYLHLPEDNAATLNVPLYTDLVKLVSLLCYEIAIEGRLPEKE